MKIWHSVSAAILLAFCMTAFPVVQAAPIKQFQQPVLPAYKVRAFFFFGVKGGYTLSTSCAFVRDFGFSPEPLPIACHQGPPAIVPVHAGSERFLFPDNWPALFESRHQ